MEKIIELIEEKLQEQDATINMQKWKISDLAAKLEEAEKTIERMRKEHETV